MTNWTDVTLYSLDGASLSSGPEHRRALNEYRATGAIAGYMLVPHDPAALDDGSEYEGPDVSQIDWTGIEGEH